MLSVKYEKGQPGVEISGKDCKIVEIDQNAHRNKKKAPYNRNNSHVHFNLSKYQRNLCIPKDVNKNGIPKPME